LSDFEESAADPIPVADADGIVRQSLNREVLAELSVNEVGSPQLLAPISVRLHLVGEDGALFTPMSGQIALTVSVEIQPPNPAAAAHRILPYPRVNRAAAPSDVEWKPHVHG
jgi:hypothetical protein